MIEVKNGGARYGNVLVRCIPSIAAVSCLAAFILLFFHDSATLYHRILEHWGVQGFSLPFLDTDGLLAARDCARLGFDVIAVDPCDILGRVHNYSPFWLVLPSLSLGRTDRVAAGLICDVLFLLSLALLPPARSPTELMLRLAGTFSPMVAFAVERANFDLVVFVIALGTALAMLRSVIVRGMAFVLVLLAAALKYYPVVLMTLALRERPRRFVAICAVGTAFIGWFLTIYGHDAMRALPNVPAGSAFGDMFGAQNLVKGLYSVLRSVSFPEPTAVVLAAVVAVAALAIAASGAFRLWQDSDWPAAFSRMEPARRWLLTVGALLLVGCFAAGQSVGYRGIFFLLVLPGLFAIGKDPATRSWLPRRGAAIVAVLMWEQAIRDNLLSFCVGLGLPLFVTTILVTAAWLAREIAFWMVMILLTMPLASFVASAPVMSAIRRHRRQDVVPG